MGNEPSVSSVYLNTSSPKIENSISKFETKEKESERQVKCTALAMED